MQMCVASLGAALLLAAAVPAGAQDLKIGYVNVPFLIRNAPQTQAIDQRLRNEFAPREAELQGRAEDLQDKIEVYDRDASVMGEAESTALRREIEQLERDLNRQGQILQEEFSIRQEELVNELQSTIGAQVQTWAEDNDYDLIVSNVIYVSDAIDITEQVLAAISDD
jgi:outer membrane protein